jgi:phosphoadenosine phosphosulfate reductase
VPILHEGLHGPADRDGGAGVTTALRPTPLLAQAADAWFDGIADPVEQALAVLRWVGDTYGDYFAITSSMSDGLLSHLASEALPGVHVIFLDTGYHFAETLGTRDWITSVLPITLVNVTARQTVAEQDAVHGPQLHDRDPDLCCALRKVQPLAEALTGYIAWGSGVRRDESPSRTATRIVDFDTKRGMLKINPLAAWTQDDVDAYVARHQIPVNPLVELGFASIGCAPCTRAVAPGEDPRAGRWAGSSKTECGIHL